jgi:hypothetical protein
LKSMEALLGCWRSMLLPLTSDPELSVQVRRLQAVMAARGLVASEDMLKVGHVCLSVCLSVCSEAFTSTH